MHPARVFPSPFQASGTWGCLFTPSSVGFRKSLKFTGPIRLGILLGPKTISAVPPVETPVLKPTP